MQRITVKGDRKNKEEARLVQVDLYWHLAEGRYEGKRGPVLQVKPQRFVAPEVSSRQPHRGTLYTGVNKLRNGRVALSCRHGKNHSPHAPDPRGDDDARAEQVQ